MTRHGWNMTRQEPDMTRLGWNMTRHEPDMTRLGGDMTRLETVRTHREMARKRHETDNTGIFPAQIGLETAKMRFAHSKP